MGRIPRFVCLLLINDKDDDKDDDEVKQTSWKYIISCFMFVHCSMMRLVVKYWYTSQAGKTYNLSLNGNIFNVLKFEDENEKCADMELSILKLCQKILDMDEMNEVQF